VDLYQDPQILFFKMTFIILRPQICLLHQ